MALVAPQHPLLIINPVSRRVARARDAVQHTLLEHFPACQVAVTESAGHAKQIAAQRRPHVDAVFTLGGDGTVAEVVSALAGSEIPMGIIPGGTGNLVARSLGIPLDPTAAARALLHSRPVATDVGRYPDGHCLVFAAGVGLDATMIAEATTPLKRRWGVAAYFLVVGRAILRRPAFQFTAVVDGQEVTTDAWVVFIANFGSVLGGMLHMGPDVSPHDGALDLCVLSPATLGDAIGIAWRMFRNDFRPHRRMRFMKGRTIELRTAMPRPFESDGELLGLTPLRVSVDPGAVTFLVPATAPASR